MPHNCRSMRNGCQVGPNNVLPGYHMSKLHWNTVVVDHGITGRLLKDFIDDSYQLVLNSLPKAKQLSL